MAKITVYGADWCGDCLRSKHFLDRNNIEYEYIDIGEDPAHAETVINYNIEAGFGPKRQIPVILVGDHILSEPSNEELARVIGLDKQPREPHRL